ncbi:MAG: hemerythrin domain-containing protein [Bacteroidia bacterium]|nr:hemerythrin domain-containing protein [Bacteroidia bacterium]
MNDPIKVLMNEHEIIVDASNLVKKMIAVVDRSDLYKRSALQLLSFFRDYADKYHHHKEEEILFPEMVKQNELLASGVLQEMLENHEDFRGQLSEIEELIGQNNCSQAQQRFEDYVDALADHIAVENEEVFEIAFSLFTEDEKEKIYYRFVDIDCELGEKQKNELKDKLAEIREMIS